MSPFPVILSSPSGAGKTTIARELLRLRNDVGYSVSCTTRPAREGERDGIDYHFLAEEEFVRLTGEGAFAEHAIVHGNHYGTLRREVDTLLVEGRHVIMDIDVQGARQFAVAYPQSVLVFILPPDALTMLSRLETRGSETPETLSRRLRNAVTELRSAADYGYLVWNEDLRRAVETVSTIIDAEESRLEHIAGYRERIDSLAADLEAELARLNRSQI